MEGILIVKPTVYSCQLCYNRNMDSISSDVYKRQVVDRAQKILTDMEKGESIWQKEQERLKKMDRKELRHHLKENMKNYRSYKKRKKNRK